MNALIVDDEPLARSQHESARNGGIPILAKFRLAKFRLSHVYRRERVTAKFDVGEYWDKHVQIDVVGLREDGWTDIGECKWGPVRSARAVARQVHQTAAHFPNHGGASLGPRVFVRRKPRTVDNSVHWHDLADLYQPAP